MSQRKLELLRRKEWLLRDQFERAAKDMKETHDLIKSTDAAPKEYPFSQKQMVDMELSMLDAQIALEDEEQSSPD